ncbi:MULTISPECIES: DUF2064 domain-containing protein [Halococcus]|uniref:DUF2064 domain-containing protein n=1 Tax=Halococcus salifodinae DSM 8989 TaxID=1227456 RepID=M0N767_9EURY|nr:MULTISPECIES: DUF2064 domain-containing protein [Halococcus]EMA53403.1 hypothetical protein C450_08822 [Halococcus salifodinae DSM 8989]
MPTTAVLCDPPHEGLVLTELAATTPLSKAETADLYAAMYADTLRAVEASASELLVNYRSDEDLPGEPDGEDADDAESAVRNLADVALDDPGAARYEVQIGSTFAARMGNTVSHLLDTEDAGSVAVIEPTVPFLTRSALDGMAMKLRRSDVVLGPASAGRVHYAGFASPIDFEDADAPPAIETLTDRAHDAGHEVDFGPMAPLIETREDMIGALSLIRARRRAGREVPARTAACLDDLGLEVVENEGDLALSKPDTDSD